MSTPARLLALPLLLAATFPATALDAPDRVVASIRKACLAVGGKPRIDGAAALAQPSLRGGDATDWVIPAAAVRCDGVAGFHPHDALYAADGTQLVDRLPAERTLVDSEPRRFALKWPAADCATGRDCIVWKIWNGSRVVDEVVPYGETTTPPAVDAPIVPLRGRLGDWTHNGSTVFFDVSNRRIVYTEPKPAIAGTIRPGQVMYVGDLPGEFGRKVEGVAFTFRKGCPPAPYRVKGEHLDGWHWRMAGAAPVRAPTGCAVVGYDAKSPNAVLLFERLSD